MAQYSMQCELISYVLDIIWLHFTVESRYSSSTIFVTKAIKPGLEGHEKQEGAPVWNNETNYWCQDMSRYVKVIEAATG